MAAYLITGCSRGLGLTLTTHLARLPASKAKVIFATVRADPTPALKSLVDSSSGRVVPVFLDASEPKSVKAAVATVEQHLRGKGLDVLINNAGVMSTSPKGIDTMQVFTFLCAVVIWEMWTDLSSAFDINVVGVQTVTAAFLPLLRKGETKKVMNVSSTLGSIGMAPSFGSGRTPAYKVSKAALNMLTVQWALDMAKEGFTFLAISPGWVKTDLGGPYADIEPDQSAEAVLEILDTKGKADNGKFFNIRIRGMEEKPGPDKYAGQEPAW